MPAGTAPPGEPAACEAQVRGYIANQTKAAQDAQSLINTGPNDIARCRNDEAASRSSHAYAERSAAGIEGALGELRTRKESLLRLEKIIQNEVKVATSFAQEFQSYLRDVIVALNTDVSADSQLSIRELQTSLSNELSRANTEDQKQVLRLVISMTDEIISAGRSVTGRSNSLSERLKSSLTNSAGNKNFSTFTKAAIEGALSKADIDSMNLSEKMSTLALLATASLDGIKEQKTEVTKKIESQTAIKKNYEEFAKRNLEYAGSTKAACDALQARVTAAPAERDSWQAAVNQNNEYLNQNRCRQDKCHWEAPEHYIRD